MNKFNKQTDQQSSECKNAVHGNVYQTKLLMLFLYRGIASNYSFRVGTEIKEANKFDDVVFEFINNGSKEYRLLQAKHTLDENKVITSINLLSSTGPFSLVRYFNSYVVIKNENFFKDSIIKDVIIYTNLGFNTRSLECDQIKIEELTEPDDILDIKYDKSIQKKPLLCRFSQDFSSKLEKTVLDALAKQLVNCFLHYTVIKEKDDIFKPYHLFLAKDLINIEAKNLHDRFITNKELSEFASKFRKHFCDEINDKKLTLENINKAIAEKLTIRGNKVGFNLSKNFGIVDKEDKILLNNSFHKIMEDFLDHLIFAVNQPNEDQLERIIKSEIGEKFVYNEFFITMLNFLQGKLEKKFITHEEGKAFFNNPKCHVARLRLTTSIGEYCASIENRDVRFGDSKLKQFEELFTTSEKRVVHALSPHTTIFLSIKFYQLLKEKDYVIFIHSKTLLISENAENVITVFQSKLIQILVIECRDLEEIPEEILSKLKEITIKYNDKRLIFISKEQDAITLKLSTFFSNEIIYQKITEIDPTLSDFAEETQQNLLSRSKVIFQGYKVILNDLIGSQPEELIDTVTLLKIIDKEELKIGKPVCSLGKIEDYYIDRIFNYQETIRTECFQIEDMHDVFVVSDVDTQELFFLTPKPVKKYEDLEKSSMENVRFIVISNLENIEQNLIKLKEYFGVNVHLIGKKNNKYIWKKSCGSLSNLRKYISQEIENTSEYQADETFIMGQDRAMIISAEPGMGKSSVLTNLARKIKAADEHSWVIRINLNDHTDSLSKIDSNIGMENITTWLTGILNLETYFEEQLFKQRIAKIGKLVLLFDGFDEISPTYKAKVMRILELLLKTKIDKILITTRPHLRQELEQRLSVFSYTLKPLTRKEQTQFLKKFWTKQCDLSNINEEYINEYIDALLNLLEDSILEKEAQFISIPLQTKMFAEVFESCLKESYLSENPSIRLPVKLNLLELYDLFIDKKYSIYCNEKKKEDATNTRVKGDHKKLIKIFKQEHQLLALKMLYEESQLQTLLSSSEIKTLTELLKDLKEGNENTGFVSRIIDEKPIFIHRTFAEYFAALWFVQNRDKKKVNTYLRNIIFDEGNYVLRNFFDRLLARKEVEKNNDELHEAVLNHDFNKVCTLLKDNPEIVNSLDAGGRSSLHLASGYGYLDVVSFLLDHDACVNMHDELFEWSALSYADKCGKWNVAELLLQSGANGGDMFEAMKCIKNYKPENKTVTLLHIASQKGYTKLAEFIKDEIPNIDCLNEENKTPLQLAAENGHLSIVQLLLEKGANINNNCANAAPHRRGPSKWTALHWAVRRNQIAVVKYLLHKKAEIIGDSLKDTPLDIAIEFGFMEIVSCFNPTREELLLASVANNNVMMLEENLARNQSLSGLLHIAAKSGSLDVVRYLVRNGADINECETSTPLTFAAHEGHYDVVKFLVDEGAEINKAGAEGWVPLIAAARSTNSTDNSSKGNYLPIVKYLIEEKNVDINISDSKGTTGLHTAAFHGRVEMVEFLIRKGADINAVDYLGCTVVFSAACNNNMKIVELLLNQNAKIDSDELELTVLHLAALHNSIHIVSYLVEEKGVNVNVGKHTSITPLHFAALTGSVESIKYLIEHGADSEAVVNFSACPRL